MAHKRNSVEVPELEKLLAGKKKKYVRYEEGAVLYSMGKNSFRQVAQDAHAVVRLKRILNELNNSFSGRNEVVERLCRYPLLIIDDFGMERDTNYALEQVYNIIDSRYRSKRPLIITTNLTLDEIRHPQDVAHARIYDRVLEMCVPVSCFGTSIRKDTAQEKLNNLKSLIG